MKNDDELRKYIVLGYSRKKIADLLNRSESAVDKRIKKLFDLYGVDNRGELIRELLLEEKE